MSMKFLDCVLITFAVIALTCSRTDQPVGNTPEKFTRVIKEPFGQSAEVYAKLYQYCWVAKDTSDLKFYVRDRRKDSTVVFSSAHQAQIDFDVLLDSIKQVFSQINTDFDLGKLQSLNFEQPIFYPDLNRTLSEAYQQQYSDTTIDYPTLQGFLMSSSITGKLNDFLRPLSKKVKSYHIEKFHLLDKKQSSLQYPDMDFTDYPEFTLFGSQMQVELEDVSE